MGNGFSKSARIPFEFDHPRSTPEPEQGKVARAAVLQCISTPPLVGGQGVGSPCVVPSTDDLDGQPQLLDAALVLAMAREGVGLSRER